MKKIFLIAGLAALLSSSALAADLSYPVKASPAPVLLSPPWAGWSVSLFGGWGQSNEKTNIAGTEPIGKALVDIGLVPRSQDTRTDGAMLGGEVGYHWQTGMLVYGLGADIRWTNIDGSATQVFTAAPLGFNASLTTTTKTSMDWMATVTGDVGFLVTDRVLLYGKAGVAFADLKTNTTVALATPIPVLNATAAGSSSGVETGWVVGGGVKFSLPANWYGDVGYEYASFGSRSNAANATILGTKVGFNAQHDDNFHFVRAGLGYRFNP